jgi:hypothetical protein
MMTNRPSGGRLSAVQAGFYPGFGLVEVMRTTGIERM